MTPEEKEYYDNLKNDKSLNEYAFDQLFETINGKVIRLENKEFRLIGGIPFITEAEDSSPISELQIQNLESSNFEEINNTHQSPENSFDKKIIILPLDINKRGSFSDSFYIQRGLLDLGYSSAALSDLSSEDLNKIGNGEALPFYIDLVLKQNKNETEEHYNKRWLTNTLYNSEDHLLHFISSKDQSGVLMLKMNLSAYNLLKSSSKSNLNIIAKDLQSLLSKNSESNFSTDQITAVIETELILQRQDQENKYDPTVKAFQKNEITEVYYQNKCNDGTLVTVHVYLNRNTLVYSYSTLEEAKSVTRLELTNEPFVVFKKGGNWEKSEFLIDFKYNNGKVPDFQNISNEERNEISEKLIPFLKISGLKENEKQMALLDKKLKTLLSNEFYNDVKLAVNIKSYPDDYKFIVANSFENIQKIKAQNDRITTYYYQNIEGTPDITIDITLD